MADVQRRDWTAEQYFADDSISRSDLDEFEDGPSLYAGRRNGSIPREEPSAAMELGTAVHTAVLEPERWERECAAKVGSIVEKQVFAGKGAKQAEAEWRASLPKGSVVKTFLQREEFLADITKANAMARSLATLQTPAARRARRIIAQCQREVSYTWTDTDPGLAAGPMRCRARLDLLCMTPTGPAIFDLKTTADPSELGFAKSASNLRYLWQPAHYNVPVAEETGIEPTFAFICIRTKRPYDVAIYDVHPDDIAAAKQQVRRTMRVLSACIASGEWSSSWERGAKDPHGRDSGHQLLKMPPYWARENT